VHAHVHRLVSVVKMATVLEECITEEQSTIVLFFWGKKTQCKGYSLRNISCYVGKFCRVKRFHLGVRRFADD
jgi:hypothetical protein